MKEIKTLDAMGYNLLSSISIWSSDRGLDDILKLMKFESIDKITLEHEKVQEHINLILESDAKKGKEPLSGGQWMLYLSHNGIGWTFIEVGYFVFEQVEEITTCFVVLPDGTEDTLYLKEISAPKLEDFTYFFANGDKFEGKVTSSNTLAHYTNRKLNKKK